jgi:hypothetical protein
MRDEYATVLYTRDLRVHTADVPPNHAARDAGIAHAMDDIQVLVRT